MKTFSKLSLIIIFSSLLILLFSCGKKESRQINNKQNLIIISVNNGPKEGEDERIEEQKLQNKIFQKYYPNGLIEASSWQFSPETFLSRMAIGTCTDVVGVFASDVLSIMEKGYALDITNMIKEWELFQQLRPEIIEPITRNGRIYGLPVGGIGGGYVMTLFYNKKLFKEAGIVDEKGEAKPPQTWEEFVEIAKKLTNREKNVAGFGILGGDGAGWHFLNWVWQAGGEFEKNIDGKWTAVFDSPEAVKALEFIKDLKWKHNVLQANVLTSNDDLFQLFVAEQIAMAIFTPEYLIYLVEKFKYPIENIGITLLPAGPAGRANQMGGAYNIINPTTSKEKQKMAFNFLTFTYNLEWIEEQCKLLKQQGRVFGFATLPIFKEEYQSKINAIIDKYRTVPGDIALMAEAVKYVRPEPPYYCQQLYQEALTPLIQAVLTDKNVDCEKLLKDGAKKFQTGFLDKIGQ